MSERFTPESTEMTTTPERPKKKFRVRIEMEGYGADGQEITGDELYEVVDVDAPDADAASDIAANMDFGNRRVSFVDEPTAIEDGEK